jgi:hypothetical protein
MTEAENWRIALELYKDHPKRRSEAGSPAFLSVPIRKPKASRSLTAS